MGDPAPPRRRFAPVPIETTFQSVRSQAPKTQPGGHTDELTPEPSPREQSPDPVVFQPGKRRFAPQLIETSRRTRRVGDTGPATKPADKTDITPYTNHIYVQRNKSRRKPRDQSSHNQTVLHKGARRESEDENAGNYVLEWAAKEAERQMHEDALAAFPNSRAREGGAAHFYFRESSGDDSLSSSTSPVPLREQPKALHGRQPRAARRKSSDLGYWHKHMQEHAEKVAAERGDTMHDADADGDLDGDVDMDDSELDNMELDSPPDPMWTTNSRKRSQPGAARGPIGETYMPLVGSTTTVLQETKAAQVGPASATSSSATGRPIGESHMPLVPPPVSGMPATKLSLWRTSTETPPAEVVLWRGYCYKDSRNKHEYRAGRTAAPDPFGRGSMSDEPESSSQSSPPPPPEHRLRSGEAKGLHMLHGLEEKLKREKANVEREDRIHSEFNDAFITQVYNYLSLGYPPWPATLIRSSPSSPRSASPTCVPTTPAKWPTATWSRKHRCPKTSAVPDGEPPGLHPGVGSPTSQPRHT
ncbi:conserved hypothetical protein [Verticillium alfalfae VaMs.102]|uniref:Uncharacterized protein n=1 Tax=Verticillium alfalfae (strain VaMs.102 / ATCC MYA-4576 / FGSC 10136) TaxID=526221 RepID=C9SCJ6_VERA1|nr:conserved hypothetical protein [Verticillium alfalfae VaMs.102]EEY16811.1 conserved hypothetical protein [Verticillium alfalfae VaMs.102]